MTTDRIKTDGIVLMECAYGENDKMLTVLSSEYGKMSVSAKGAKKNNSKFLATSQSFCYSHMELAPGKNGIYTLCEAELINSFYDLRTDYDALVVATDLSKLVMKVAQEECGDSDMMRLFLNTLYFLMQKKNPNLLAATFKIRLVYDQGMLEEVKSKNITVQKAADYIVSTDMKGLFSFNVSENVLTELMAIADKAVKNMLSY